MEEPHGECIARDVPRALGREMLRLAPFVGLAIASGAAFDLLGTGAPLALRAKGLSLQDAGWLQVIYLPIGLAFLWAPIVDRVRPLPLPRRIAWIVAAQIAASLLLLALGLNAGWPLAATVAAGLVLSVVLATTDIAAQAFVVETMAPAQRAPVATARLVGASFGSAIGIGLATSGQGDLSRGLLVVAALNVAVLAPFLLRRAGPAVTPAPSAPAIMPHRRRWRRVLGGGAVIGGYAIPAIMLGTVPGLFLLDLGLPLPATGAVTGLVTTAITIAMMLLSSYLLVRMPIARQVLIMGIGVVASGLLLVGAAHWHWVPLAIAGVLLEDAFDAGFNVPLANLIYRWAEGAHAATDYAVLSGISFLISFPTRVFSPMLAALLGWPAYLAIATALYALAVVALRRSDRRETQDD